MNFKIKQQSGILIFISGISGSSKTTIGKKLVEDHLENRIFIDQDLFFSRNKPITKLSTGETVVVYDDEQAVAWEKLNYALESNLQSHNVVLVGFALWQDKIHIKPNLHFLLIRDHLVNGQHNMETLPNIVYSARQNSSRFTGKKNEMLMVREVVIPFYFKTLAKLGPVIKIEVMVQENGQYQTKPVHVVVGECMKHIQEYLPNIC